MVRRAVFDSRLCECAPERRGRGKVEGPGAALLFGRCGVITTLDKVESKCSLNVSLPLFSSLWCCSWTSRPTKMFARLQTGPVAACQGDFSHRDSLAWVNRL